MSYQQWIDEYGYPPMNDVYKLYESIKNNTSVIGFIVRVFREKGWNAYADAVDHVSAIYYATYECIDDVLYNIFNELENELED